MLGFFRRFSRAIHGVLTTGNHEEYTGEAELWGEFVADRGFTVLKVWRTSHAYPYHSSTGRHVIQKKTFFFFKLTFFSKKLCFLPPQLLCTQRQALGFSRTRNGELAHSEAYFYNRPASHIKSYRIISYHDPVWTLGFAPLFLAPVVSCFFFFHSIQPRTRG